MGPVRTEVMWHCVLDAVDCAATASGVLDVLDLGGGTGGDAVRLAALGHRVTVVDPSPDALASLSRRGVEAGLEHAVTGLLADATDLLDHVPASSFDLVLCHGVLEHVDDPYQALAAVAAALRADGFVSVVVAGRHGAVVARALAGDFATSEKLFDTTAQTWDIRTQGPRRFVVDEVEQLLGAHALVPVRTTALRVFADLVPSDLVDAEPGSREALYSLERRVRNSPEFTALSAGLQLIARLDLDSEHHDSGGNRAAL